MTFVSGEIDPSQSLGGGSPARNAPAPANQVTFSRRELKRILDLYGRKVAAGEWRDYAIDFLKDRAVFSVFRRSSETPIYRIEKNPKLARRQGAYSVLTQTGLYVADKWRDLSSELPQRFATVRKIGEISRRRNDQDVERYVVYRVEGPSAAILKLSTTSMAAAPSASSAQIPKRAAPL